MTQPRPYLLTFAILLCTFFSMPAMAQDDPLPYRVAAPMSHAKLTLFPLYALADTTPAGEYLTFDEASKRRVLKITELDGNTSDARVNAVHVSNKGDKPVLILAGEIVLGGKQDRVIGKDTIIPPKSKRVEVGVFCVERGRWDGKTANFTSSRSMGHMKLRDKAVFSSDQGEVWKEVGDANSKANVSNATDTYRASVTRAKSDTTVERYVAAIVPPLTRDTKALGVVVAIAGKVVAVDAFANPQLFGKVRDKLVRSYAFEAVSTDIKGKMKTPDNKDVDTFFKKVRASKVTSKRDSSGAADNVYFDSDEIQGNESRSKTRKPAHKYFRAK